MANRNYNKDDSLQRFAKAWPSLTPWKRYKIWIVLTWDLCRHNPIKMAWEIVDHYFERYGPQTVMVCALLAWLIFLVQP